MKFHIRIDIQVLMFCLQVLPGLYVGNYQDSKDLVQLEQCGVTHIVAVHDNAKRVFKVLKGLCTKNFTGFKNVISSPDQGIIGKKSDNSQ